MKKFLIKDERDFLVCSDCAYFKREEVIDFNYPDIVKGKCKKHNKTVDNRWETKCKDNTYFCQCDMCVHFVETGGVCEDYPYECAHLNIPCKENDRVCEFYQDSEE